MVLDDFTHKEYPPDFEKIKEFLNNHKFKILFSSKRYRPPIMFCIGLFTDIISEFRNKVITGVWEKWGFESIIIGKLK